MLILNAAVPSSTDKNRYISVQTTNQQRCAILAFAKLVVTSRLSTIISASALSKIVKACMCTSYKSHN
jgi:hypothetical protein